MKLVFIAHGSRATFEVADIGIVVGYYESALELACA